MELSIWTSSFDGVRFGRMLFGLGVGFVALSGFFVGLALATPEEAEEEEIEIASLELAEEPEQVEEELEPEPEEIEAVEDMVEQAGPRLASLKPPTEIPEDKPKEADPTDLGDGGTDPYAATGGKGRKGTGKGKGEGDGKAEEKKEEKAAPPPPPPKPSGPVRVTEKMTPPKPISMPYPVHPEHLKAQGVEGVVVMKYVIDAQGNVPAAQPVRGPMELAQVCWGVMKSWKFEPAKDENGNPVSVTRIARFTFTIETD